MVTNEIATKQDIARIEKLLEDYASKVNDKQVIQKRAYSRKETCLILNISSEKLTRLESEGVLAGRDYIKNTLSGKTYYKASAVHKLIDDLPG